MTNATTYPCPRCHCYAATAPDTLCPQCEIDKERGYEALYLTGRCANGAEAGHGVLYHAVPMAGSPLYILGKGAAPSAALNLAAGPRGWSSYKGREVTCARCLKKLAAGGGK